MQRPASLEAALKRMGAALDQLEAASGRLTRIGAEKADLQEVLAVMGDDRNRLAGDLDAATARAQALQQATQQIGQRLDHAGAVLRRLLASGEPVSEPAAGDLREEG